MPSIGDMMEVVDLLRVDGVSIQQEHCVAVRNRNSKCHKCQEACIANAIDIKANSITLVPGLCVNCGCCVAACPMGAITSVSPSQVEATDEMVRHGNAKSRCTIVACARKGSKGEADSDKFTQIPCLGHLTEGQLLDVVAAGFDDVVLVDGNCATCRFGAASERIDQTIEEAIKLLDAADAQAIITRQSDFPKEALLYSEKEARGMHRRGIMLQTGGYMKTVAGRVVQKTVDDKLGLDSEKKDAIQKLKVGQTGKLPKVEPAMNYRMLEDMEALSGGAPLEGQLDTRHFGSVEIDADECSGCGMCVMFCPTGALSHAEYDRPEREDRRYLEFNPSQCTQCKLCKDVCLRYCLEVKSKVMLQDLFDMEPALLEIMTPSDGSFLADLKKKYGK